MINEIEIEAPDLTTYQNDILYNDSRFTITEASTKVGKTFSHIWWLFEQAHRPDLEPNSNVWWVAPVYAQAKIAFNRMKSAVVRSGAYKIIENPPMITTPLGTHIHFKSAEKPDNLFGEDVFACVFDEAPRARKEAFEALYSTLTHTKGQMKLIGNFGGTANWMHQLKERVTDDSDYAYFKVTAWDAVEAGILDEEIILQAQRDLPPKVFKQLYLAEEQESDDMLCSFDAISDLWTNTHVMGGTMYITADIALQGSDKLVIIVWSGHKIVNLQTVAKCEANEVEVLLKTIAEKWKVGRSNIVYDADGLGTFLRGYLKGAKPFNNGGRPIKQKGRDVNYKNLKSQCGFKLATTINDRSIFIDCEVDKGLVIKELECLQSYALDNEGKIQVMPKAKIKEVIGHSPDILDALVMRMYFDIKPQGNYVVSSV